jgi:hypothetical protein
MVVCIGVGAFPGEEELPGGYAAGIVGGREDPRISGTTKLCGDAGAADDVGEKV